MIRKEKTMETIEYFFRFSLKIFVTLGNSLCFISTVCERKLPAKTEGVLRGSKSPSKRTPDFETRQNVTQGTKEPENPQLSLMMYDTLS